MYKKHTRTKPCKEHVYNIGENVFSLLEYSHCRLTANTIPVLVEWGLTP